MATTALINSLYSVPLFLGRPKVNQKVFLATASALLSSGKNFCITALLGEPGGQLTAVYLVPVCS